MVIWTEHRGPDRPIIECVGRYSGEICSKFAFLGESDGHLDEDPTSFQPQQRY